MKRMTGICLVFATVMGIVTFGAKKKVASLEAELLRTNSQIRMLEESFQILSAEWSFLNDPSRIQKLAEKYLDLGPSDPIQLVSHENFLPKTSSYDSEAMLRLASSVMDLSADEGQ